MAKKTPTSFSLDPHLVNGLRIRSYDLSASLGKRVTCSDIVADALRKYGVRAVDPDKAKKKRVAK